jgi:hypothetical protein
MPAAIEQARAMIASGALGKRLQKEFIKQSKIEQTQRDRSADNGQS